ncbi:MAG: DUF547 domain-containing protein [Cyanobacteria bacterium]|nr:DUF547 domain-containing protein [Cyanobacteriota bacterium]
MVRKTILSLSLISILLGGCSIASVPTQSEASAPVSEADLEAAYDAYQEVLETYVDAEGLVDYVGLQQNREKLDQFNAAIAMVSDDMYNSWPEAEQIAFWVNAYNSLTLASIIDQDPIRDIKEIVGVWRIRQHPIQKQSKTLDDIEHQTLRVDFNEPRIHAALVCAAISCPLLRQEPFRGGNLDAQLEDQVQTFLAKADGFRIDQAAGKVYLSTIFQWFGEDWIPTYGIEEGFAGNEAERSVLNFISNYVSAEEKAYLEAGEYDVVYIDYDWSLNEQS